MEEILASIRRIISDDEALQPSGPEETRPSSLSNVLDIAELHVSPMTATSPNEPLLGPWSRGEMLIPEIHFEDDVAKDHHVSPERGGQASSPAGMHESLLKAAAPIAPNEPAAAEALISNETDASVSGAFDRLTASLKPSQPQTVEDLMKEMLRPMLKVWLDDNLPSLVERLVRDEIQRVTRRQG